MVGLTQLSEVGKRWLVGLLAIYPSTYRIPLVGREIQITWEAETEVRVFEEQAISPRFVRVVEARGVVGGVQHVSRLRQGPFVDRFLLVTREEGDEPLAVEEAKLLEAEVRLDLKGLKLDVVS